MSAYTSLAANGRFEVLRNETTDSIIIADTVSHDDIAEVFHNERHTVSQSVYQARETAQLFAASHDLLIALSWFINDIDDTHTVMVDFDANVARARAAIEKATAS